MAVIKIQSEIEKIEVKNERDELVCTLLVNTNDTSIVNKIAELYKNASTIAEANKAEIEALKIDGDLDVDTIQKIVDINSKKTKEVIREIESLIGEGTISEIFADNYALNPDFVPSVDVLADLILQFAEIVSNFFKNRQEKANKYTPTKKGKHTKTKEELLNRYKETMNE